MLKRLSMRPLMHMFNNGGVETWNVWYVHLFVLIHLWSGSEY